jgi:hypothetical protein
LDDDDDDDDDVNIKRAWESVRDNMKDSAIESLGYYELKQHKPWFDKECSKLLYLRKHAKLQWLQNPSQTHGDDMNNVRCETSRNYRVKKRKYLKEKTSLKQTLRTNISRDLYTGINEFKKGY